MKTSKMRRVGWIGVFCDGEVASWTFSATSRRWVYEEVVGYTGHPKVVEVFIKEKS